MSVRIVQLGSERRPDEGLRIGTVRRPPRGVAKERFAADDWYEARLLGLLAALSHHTDLSVGCYCDDEARCHRSVLRELLTENGAEIE